jgi:hypothetical protein
MKSNYNIKCSLKKCAIPQRYHFNGKNDDQPAASDLPSAEARFGQAEIFGIEIGNGVEDH